uniref:Inosine/uridine-preferring nucleoside hydrolase domain-containing protein n=1 Tax=Ditylenchus dipsaci TaxID=166011 RepID=A0A915DRJ3_9BILA
MHVLKLLLLIFSFILLFKNNVSTPSKSIKFVQSAYNSAARILSAQRANILPSVTSYDSVPFTYQNGKIGFISDRSMPLVKMPKMQLGLFASHHEKLASLSHTKSNPSASFYPFAYSTFISQNKSAPCQNEGAVDIDMIISERLTFKRNVIIITDMEPDDRIALAVVAARMADKVLFVGTSVMNAERKAALAQKQFALFDSMKHVPVFAGTGGGKKVDITSTKAGESYSQEGTHILSAEELEQYSKEKTPKAKNYAQEALKSTFKIASNKGIKVKILLLAPPSDLVEFIEDEKYRETIEHIHIMGGWMEVKGSDEKHSTYNVNMDVNSSAKLMEYGKEISMTLYSSHAIKSAVWENCSTENRGKKAFPEGSINSKNCPQLIEMIFDKQVTCLKPIQIATKSWDNHLITMNTVMKDRIGVSNLGKQFTPADPLVVIGFLNPDMLINPKYVSVIIHVDDRTDQGYRIEVKEDKESKIRLVDINVRTFFDEMVDSFKQIVKQYKN